MIIERQQEHVLIGWMDETCFSPDLKLLLRAADKTLASWSFADIRFEAAISGKRYWSLALASSDQALSVVDGSLQLLLLADGREKAFRIFGPLQETLKMRSLDLARLGSTFKLLPGPHREAFRRAVEYGTRPHIRSAVKRQRACVITYANDSGGWFEVFRRHYEQQLGDTAFIYVVTPQPESFDGERLGGITGLRGFAFDDFARSQLLSGMARGLAAYYEWVIVADVDELIFVESPDGIGCRTLADRLGDPELPEISFSLGLDIIQGANEADFDHAAPLLGQRRYAVPNSGMCKPHITRGTVNLDIGFHYCQVPPRFAPSGTGFVMFHLKYACRTTRTDVARIVERTAYADDRIRSYAYDSVGRRSAHPGLKAASPDTAVVLRQWDRQDFERRIRAQVGYDADRDLHVGKNFTEDVVIDLRGHTGE
ncbi:hypothetical protein [Rivibacter subsaxonicus]|uniref:Glycosyl transferase family 2 n=1 Tax=Rivibacter subsaxonicus TaxID=457575 RepID=A0A4Q7VN97_9BURK|nr:hypothetical protein [Rivibacter subsaxonicus]RZT97608.1 hypothetical protein EV670_1999 [Rivibacter subsaxonicus]